MRIRKATPADAAEICSLHRASIRELCAKSYSAEQIRAWIEPLDPSLYVPAMEEYEFHVAEGARILGFSILNIVGAELNAIYLHPEAVGQGIGKEMLEFCEHLARRRSVRSVKLKATLNAAGFYEACGYERVGKGVHRTRNGTALQCVEMVKQL